MYIEEYWENYIGDNDDSLTLLEYLGGKQKEEISLEEIFSDTGLKKLQGNFKQTDSCLGFVDSNGLEIEFYYAINLIADLSALLLECKMNGSVDLCDLSDFYEPNGNIRITATPEEHNLINKTLLDFSTSPLSYDLSEIVPEEDMVEMASVCEKLRKELYE